MKKIVFIFLAMCFLCQVGFAQILTIESCYVSQKKSPTSIKQKMVPYSVIILSNGDMLTYDETFIKKWRLRDREYYTNTASCNLKPTEKYPKGTLVYKYPSGDKFELVQMEQVGTYTIKKVSVREINIEFNANLDFSYRGFGMFVGLVGSTSSSGGIHATVSGGTKTVVNVIFTNGQTASIPAGDDPMWLEATTGQQVEHYKVRDYNIYKLIF